jgi:beta-lactamase class A
LDAGPQVRGAGYAHLLRARRLPFHDVLLMMIANSDNLCTNLVIQRFGIEHLNAIFQKELGLTGGTVLQRKLMDFEARARGLDNWVSAHDCIHLFELVDALPAPQRAWVDNMLLHCEDSSMLLRDVDRDSLHFAHKTGSIPGVMNDWGYTQDCQIFLLTNGIHDEPAANALFGQAGRRLVGQR